MEKTNDSKVEILDSSATLSELDDDDVDVLHLGYLEYEMETFSTKEEKLFSFYVHDEIVAIVGFLGSQTFSVWQALMTDWGEMFNQKEGQILERQLVDFYWTCGYTNQSLDQSYAQYLENYKKNVRLNRKRKNQKGDTAQVKNEDPLDKATYRANIGHRLCSYFQDNRKKPMIAALMVKLSDAKEGTKNASRLQNLGKDIVDLANLVLNGRNAKVWRQRICLPDDMINSFFPGGRDEVESGVDPDPILDDSSQQNL